jgi:hypothetical protein
MPSQVPALISSKAFHCKKAKIDAKKTCDLRRCVGEKERVYAGRWKEEAVGRGR